MAVGPSDLVGHAVAVGVRVSVCVPREVVHAVVGAVAVVVVVGVGADPVAVHVVPLGVVQRERVIRVVPSVAVVVVVLGTGVVVRDVDAYGGPVAVAQCYLSGRWRLGVFCVAERGVC